MGSRWFRQDCPKLDQSLCECVCFGEKLKAQLKLNLFRLRFFFIRVLLLNFSLACETVPANISLDCLHIKSLPWVGGMT